MTPNEKDFIKNIRDYFGIEINELGENRILFYLNQFIESSNFKPVEKIVYRDKEVIKYVYQKRKRKVIVSDEQLMIDALAYCKEANIPKDGFLPTKASLNTENYRIPRSLVKHRSEFSNRMKNKGAMVVQLCELFHVNNATVRYYILGDKSGSNKFNKNKQNGTKANKNEG